MDVKVDKGIKIPAVRNSHFPFKTIAVGESFIVPSYSNSVMASKLYKPKEFSTRKMPDGTLRCWRIK